MNALNIQVTKALGKSGSYLKMTIINLIVSILLVVLTVNLGVIWIAAGGILSAVFTTFMNTLPVKQSLNYGFVNQIKDICPVILLAVSMVVFTSLIDLIDLPVIASLFLKIAFGIIYYVLVSYLFKNECFFYIFNLIFSKRKKN